MAHEYLFTRPAGADLDGGTELTPQQIIVLRKQTRDKASAWRAEGNAAVTAWLDGELSKMREACRRNGHLVDPESSIYIVEDDAGKAFRARTCMVCEGHVEVT